MTAKAEQTAHIFRTCRQRHSTELCWPPCTAGVRAKLHQSAVLTRTISLWRHILFFGIISSSFVLLRLLSKQTVTGFLPTLTSRVSNTNNNFSATVPYDMEQQKKEMKEFLDDLTTRDQRMMFAVITFVHTADTKEQLDQDTEALLTTARKHL